jgi:ribosome-binding factor A
VATHNRPVRVAEEFRQEISALLARGLKDPRITGFVTVTGAKMSPDLREATVYVSVHGEEAVREKTMEGLRAAATFLQREAGRLIGLRHTPHLRFIYDESVERGDRIDRLLREARVRDTESAGLRQAQEERAAEPGEPGSGAEAPPAAPATAPHDDEP